jgi:RNA polymerase sigma-70 factor (ECF subfamily)
MYIVLVLLLAIVMMNEHELFEQIKSNNRNALSQFYAQQKDSFISWARTRFDVDDDTITDVYQDSIVTLYHNIVQGKITAFDVSPGAYLFGIARNLMLKKVQSNKRLVLVEDTTDYMEGTLDYNIYDRIDEEHKKYELRQAIAKLKDSCQQILKMYYFQKFSTESIMNRLNYSNTNVVKSRKNQCMKTLKSILLVSKSK